MQQWRNNLISNRLRKLKVLWILFIYSNNNNYQKANNHFLHQFGSNKTQILQAIDKNRLRRKELQHFGRFQLAKRMTNNNNSPIDLTKSYSRICSKKKTIISAILFLSKIFFTFMRNLQQLEALLNQANWRNQVIHLITYPIVQKKDQSNNLEALNLSLWTQI